MRAIFIICILGATGAWQGWAQADAGTQSPDALGFSFSLSADWQRMDTSAAAQEQARQSAKSEEDKKGLGCAQLGLSARRGNPPSVLTEVALPFGCYGQAMTDAELPGFASIASAGLQQTFDLGDPVYGSYALGSHRLWIERVKGNVKGRAEMQYTIEIACGVTKKAAVCWMTMATDDAALAAFEQISVSLDGEPATPLVPQNAFEKKPS